MTHISVYVCVSVHFYLYTYALIYIHSPTPNLCVSDSPFISCGSAHFTLVYFTEGPFKTTSTG